MNLKAKTEWRRSGERAGAGTGPAQAARLATASCSSLPLAIGFLWQFCPASFLGAPFPQRISLPTSTCSSSGPCLGPGALWNQSPARARALQVPPLLALLLILLILMEGSLPDAAQCTCLLPDPLKKEPVTAWNCHLPQLASSHPSILRDKSQRPSMSQVPATPGQGTSCSLFSCYCTLSCFPLWPQGGSPLGGMSQPPS